MRILYKYFNFSSLHEGSYSNFLCLLYCCILSFKFRFLGSGQIVSNQNLLLVTDRNSGTHNQNQNFSLIWHDLGDVTLLRLLLLGQDSNITAFLAVIRILTVISKYFNLLFNSTATNSNITAVISNIPVILL